MTTLALITHFFLYSFAVIGSSAHKNRSDFTKTHWINTSPSNSVSENENVFEAFKSMDTIIVDRDLTDRPHAYGYYNKIPLNSLPPEAVMYFFGTNVSNPSMSSLDDLNLKKMNIVIYQRLNRHDINTKDRSRYYLYFRNLSFEQNQKIQIRLVQFKQSRNGGYIWLYLDGTLLIGRDELLSTLSTQLMKHKVNELRSKSGEIQQRLKVEGEEHRQWIALQRGSVLWILGIKENQRRELIMEVQHTFHESHVRRGKQLVDQRNWNWNSNRNRTLSFRQKEIIADLRKREMIHHHGSRTNSVIPDENKK